MRLDLGFRILSYGYSTVLDGRKKHLNIEWKKWKERKDMVVGYSEFTFWVKSGQEILIKEFVKVKDKTNTSIWHGKRLLLLYEREREREHYE